MANAFNEHFINIGSSLAQQISQPNHPPEYYINSVEKIFIFREIFEQEVLTLLLNMSTNKAKYVNHGNGKFKRIPRFIRLDQERT